MADEYPWFRMYNEATHDPKLRFIAFNSQIPFVTVFGAWGIILAMASRSPERGRLLLAEGFPANEVYILSELGIPQASDILDGLFRMGLLEQDDEGVIVVSHWEKRQPSSDNSLERTRRYRDRRESNGMSRGAKYSLTTVSALYDNKCVYCLSPKSLTVDHVLPIELGGTDDPLNLVSACRQCNSGKRNRTPEQAGLTFKFPEAEKRFKQYLAKSSSAPTVTVTPNAVTVTVTSPDLDTEKDKYINNTREAELDPPHEPDGLWGDDLAEDLGDVVDAAAPEGESYAAAYKRLKSEQGFEGFPAVRTQRDVKLLPLINTRAVYTWVSVTFHAPEYDQLPYLVKQLGDNPNREVLLAVWEMWRGNDYSPGKIIGVLEWYQLRLKDPNWQPTYGQKARASPKTNGVYKGKSKANGKAEFDPTTIGQSL